MRGFLVGMSLASLMFAAEIVILGSVTWRNCLFAVVCYTAGCVARDIDHTPIAKEGQE